MYSKLPSFVLGFHGTDKSICEKIILSKDLLHYKKHEYDWLGHGMYFWENDPDRALEYAKLLKHTPNRTEEPIINPAVIGAIIDLGNCLNLIEYKNLDILRFAYSNFIKLCKEDNQELPKQAPLNNEKDVLKRPLDCAVIESLHQSMRTLKLDEFDSVRGVFWEGEELYPNAGFKEKNHIQICVRNPNCIKGFFDPRILDVTWKKP